MINRSISCMHLKCRKQANKIMRPYTTCKKKQNYTILIQSTLLCISTTHDSTIFQFSKPTFRKIVWVVSTFHFHIFSYQHKIYTFLLYHTQKLNYFSQPNKINNKFKTKLQQVRQGGFAVSGQASN